MQSTEEEVGVGDGEGTAFAVASRPGMSAGRLGTDVKDAVSVCQDGATARGDRVDVELRDLNGDAGRGGSEDVLIIPAEPRHIG